MILGVGQPIELPCAFQRGADELTEGPARTTALARSRSTVAYSEGTWTAPGPCVMSTTVNEGIYGFVLKPGALQKNDANVFGYDLTRVLEQDCPIVRQKQ